MQKIKKAVSLKYPKGAPAPFITASAKGVLAEKILDTARQNNIAIVENKEMTEFLSIQEIGTCVPESTWSVLAKIFAFVMQEA